MTLGTGISLSMVVIAVVALYGITRDRWNWRRFVKRTRKRTVAPVGTQSQVNSVGGALTGGMAH